MHNHQEIIDKMSKLRELVIFSMSNYKKHPDYIWCDINLANEKILWNQQKIGLLTFHNMLQGAKEKLSFSEISL